MSSGLLIPHNDVPNLERIEILAGVIEQTIWLCRQQSRHKPVTQKAARRVSAVGIETVTDNGLAIAHYVCDYCEGTHRHLTEVDVGVANVRFNGDGDFANIDDLHSFTSLSRNASRLRVSPRPGASGIVKIPFTGAGGFRKSISPT